MNHAHASPQPELWVIVPAFREAAVLGQTLAGLFETVANVVVVDDGSDDATSEVARRSGACVVRHGVNLGQGAALATGIRFALARGATHVVSFDADGQHDPRTIADMMALLRTVDTDVVLASRFLGSTVDMSGLRRAVLRLAVAFTRWQTRLAVTDTHNGLRLFTRFAAERVSITQNGMAHASEILAQIARHRLRYVEIPTVLTYTAYSKQKGQPLSNSFKIAFELFYAAWSRQS